MTSTQARALAPALAALALALAGLGCGGSHPAELAGDDASASGGDDATTAGEGGGASFSGVDAGHSTAPFADAGCATAQAQAKRQPAYLMFVLDGSDSMRQENKWAAVVPALTTIFAQMEAAADPGIAAGLIVFPGAGGPYPAAADVPLAYVDATQNAALDTRLMTGLSLGTPTHAALDGGYGELEGFQPMAPLESGGKKVVVLLTDGVPTDDCSNAISATKIATNACVELAGQELIEAAPRGPIETFVIGVGDFPSTDNTDFDPVFLGNVAQAGGTGPAGCNPNEAAVTSDLCYFEIDPSKAQTASALQQNFETALDSIRGQVVSCTFALQSTGLGTVDPTLVNVDVDGKTVPQNAANGWTYDNPTNPTAITLNGSACTSAKADVTSAVSIVVGCATEVVK